MRPLAKFVLGATLLGSAWPTFAAAQEQAGVAVAEAAPVRQCWPELRAAGTAEPGGAIGRMIRLEAGKSPVARFDEGDSLVVVVALPAFRKPYALEFQATPDLNVRSASEILWPSVVVVDADFCTLGKWPELDFKSKYSFLTSQTTTRASVPVADAAPRYALVYSDATRVGEPIGLEINGMDMGDLRRSGQGWVMVRINR